MTAPAKSIRQLIVEAVDTRLKTILTTGNYATNIGAHVHWFRKRLDKDGLPAIVCRDRLLPPINKIRWTRTLVIEMEFHLEAATTPDTILRSALADIETAVGVDPTWGGLVEDTEYGESEKQSIDDYETVLVAGGFFLALEYTTDPWNPRA